MPSSPVQRLFLGFEIPERVRSLVRDSMRSFEPSLRRVIPQEQWHMTLVFLGECSEFALYEKFLTQPLAQPYLPTITLTHIGRGVARGQLWAYSLPTPALQRLQQEMRQRVQASGLTAPGLLLEQDFVPHIHVGDILEQAPALIVDRPLQATFVPKEIHIFRSEVVDKKRIYTSQARIELVR